MLPAAPWGERAGGGEIAQVAQSLRRPCSFIKRLGSPIGGGYRSRPLRPPSFSPNTSPSDARPVPWLRMYSR